MTKEYQNLPTGKPHISFSEVKDWNDCSYRHQLKHVKKIDLFKPSIFLDFGTGIHAACENFLKTRNMDVEIATKYLDEMWTKNAGHEGFDEVSLAKSKKEVLEILAEVPAFMDSQFPDWEFVAAEEQLYEVVGDHPHAFKGFIDGVIKAKGKKGEDIVWLLDWKSSQRGWLKQKKQDKMTAAQLVLYKTFWSKKHGIDLKKIRCAFVILKKSAKPGNHCELFPISVGEVTIKRNLKLLDNMMATVKRGIALKNKNSCTYCDYRGTEHCT